MLIQFKFLNSNPVKDVDLRDDSVWGSRLGVSCMGFGLGLGPEDVLTECPELAQWHHAIM